MIQAMLQSLLTIVLQKKVKKDAAEHMRVKSGEAGIVNV